MRQIERIVVHCSYTKPSMDIGVKEINQWHLDRGFSGCGYHFVIRRNGLIEIGRPIWKIGAHAAGYNRTSIGICLVGGMSEDGVPESNFSLAQYESLRDITHEMMLEYDTTNVCGHKDLPRVAKACPCFDVKGFFSNG